MPSPAPLFCHCWRARLGPIPPAKLATLSDVERARLARFHTTGARLAYAGAHAFLRTVLAQYAGQSPARLVLGADAQQKPAVATPIPLFFNLSYRAEWALLAVSNAGEVGVDVEETKPVAGADALVGQLFSASEQVALRHLTGAEWWALFYGIWTRKEAWAKLLGMGLALPFADFSVATWVHSAVAWQIPGRGLLHGFALDNDHAAALAIQPQSNTPPPAWQHFSYPAALSSAFKFPQ